MQASRIVDQLDALRGQFPEAPLVVFVPRTQIGHSIETALARRQQGWSGLRVLIPRHYAEAVARIDVFTSGRREAPVVAKLFRAARIVQALPDASRSETLPGWHLLADTVATAVDTLREGNVSVSAVQERVDDAQSSDTLGVIAACYEDYVRELEEKRLYDDATVYRWATDRVRDGEAPGVGETVYAVPSAVDLSEHAYQFLDALRRRGRAFVRLGVSERSEPPPETVAARFRKVRTLDGPTVEERNEEGAADGAARPEAPDRFVRAVGARGEVRAVFRDLLDEEVAFGDVTIAYADSRPYATLLADEAERVGIPLTMGTGLPATHTRTGRALRDLYEWGREDYDPAILVRMLRSGLLRTDRWLRHRDDWNEHDASADDVREEYDLEKPSLRPHEAATLLAERSYESGWEGLLSGLEAAVGELKRESDERGLNSREETRLARLALLREYVEALAAFIPRRDASGGGDVRAMARTSCRFLERFGPTDAPSKPEEERTPDEAARGLLYERLQGLADIDVSCEASGSRLAALFQQWLGDQYVQAESPRPGHVHVLPLESAGYSDRAHLHVVGLDSTTFAAPRPEGGMLQESDRRALVSSLQEPGEAARRSTPADEALWHAARALRRHRGRTCYYARIYDVEAGEERDPSSLFLQAERIDESRSAGPAEASGGEAGERRAEPEVVGLVPETDAIALSDGDQWLQSYRAGRREGRVGAASATDASARDRLRERYPWVPAGEAARQARRSGEYTVHDGLLPAGAYPDLALFGPDDRPLSASRLETLAEAPYVYFLKYVIGVRPLEEPALNEEPWLNHLRKGTLLHDIYERFMRAIDEPPTDDHASVMREVVETVLEEETEAFAPPSPVVEKAARRELLQHAMLFLRSEIERADDYAPDRFEWGFGLPPRRRNPQDAEEAVPDAEEAARLSVGEQTLRLRGRIDRVDRRRDTGALAAWDYKTGGASSYDEDDPLQDGKTLQWALYAYALESLVGEPVAESGYFFATAREMGRRISADPDRYRSEVEQVLQRLGALAESGSFPVTPRLTDVNDWKWNGYDRLVGDLRERKRELKEKEYPDDRPKPPSF